MIHPLVRGNGPRDSRLIILGERPGKIEMREGAPMVGRTGEHVYRALGLSPAEVGNLHKRPVGSIREWQTELLQRLSTRITNARCYLDENESEQEAAVGYIECAAHLQSEFAMLTEARTLLAVGADACQAVLGRSDMAKLHGSVWTRAEVDAMRALAGGVPLPPAVHTVVCSYHPAWAMRGMPQAWPMIYRAIQKAKLWSLREGGPERKFVLNLSPTPEEVSGYLAGAIAARSLLSIDLETARDNFTAIRMVGVSYAPDAAFVFPWVEPFISEFRRVMALPGIPKVGHNFAFDQKALLAYGVTLAPPIYNTIDTESILRPPFKESSKRRWLALSTCLQYRLNDWPYHKDPGDPATRAFLQAAFPEIPERLNEELYCALDAIGTRRLLLAQGPIMSKEGVYRLYMDVVAPAGPVLVRMEARGALIDEELREREKLAVGGVDGKSGRLGELGAEIQETAAQFHARRRAKLEEEIVSLKELEEHELATHPLFTGELGDTTYVGPCPKHNDYRGLTKRQKCEGCAVVYRAAGSLRAKVGELRRAYSAAVRTLAKLGDRFLHTSDAHWRTLLFDKELGLGLEPVAKTDKLGLPKVDDESIEELQQLYPQVDLLAKRVEFQHLRRRYSVVLEVPTDEAGYAHFSFSQHRTSTGRSSSGSDHDEGDKYRPSDAGNGQNWRDEDRRLIVAGPGRRWASADYEQIELRTMGRRAKDLVLLDELRRGVDVHAENAGVIYQIPADSAWTTKVWLEGREQPARQGGKKVTHMINYGAQEEKVGKIIRPWQGRPFEEMLAFVRDGSYRDVVFRALKREGRVRHYDRTMIAIGRMAEDPTLHHILYGVANTVTAKGWIDRYFAKRPRLREYQEELITRASMDGYITNAWGRKMTVWEWRWDDKGNRRPADVNDVIAFPGQSDAGEIEKAVLPGMEQAFEEVGGALRLFVHDSYDGDIPIGTEAEFREQVRAVAEREWPEMGEIPGFGLFSCPISFAFGDNWGSFDAEKNPGGLVKWHEPEALNAGVSDRLSA